MATFAPVELTVKLTVDEKLAAWFEKNFQTCDLVKELADVTSERDLLKAKLDAAERDTKTRSIS